MMKLAVLALFVLILAGGCSLQENQSSDLHVVNGYELGGDHPLVKATMALVDTNSKVPFCSATLVDPELLITAAHCVFRKSVGSYLVRANGATDFKYYQVEAHESFKKTHKYDSNFDIAWIKLSDPADSYHEPLEVWNDSGALENGQSLVMGGYGQKATHCRGSDKECGAGDLMFSDTHLQEYVNKGRLFSMMLIGPTPEKGPCFGDSGGPLAMERNGNWYLLGNFMGWDKILVQEDYNRLCENGEAIYNSVGDYIHWIEKTSGVSLTFDDANNPRQEPRVFESRTDFDTSSFIEWCQYDDIYAPSWFTTQNILRKAAEYASSVDESITGRELFENCEYAEEWVRRMIDKDPVLSFTTDAFGQGNFDHFLEDVSPLRSLAEYGLKELVLVNQRISSMEALSDIYSLESLTIMDNLPGEGIDRILPLAQLNNLKQLVVYNSGFEIDGRHLSQITNLDFLKLGYSKIFGLTDLKNKLNVRKLVLSDVVGLDIRSFAPMVLEDLEVAGVDPLVFTGSYSMLTSLRMYDVGLPETFDLEQFPSLQQLHIQGSDLKKIENWFMGENLEEVFLMGNPNLNTVGRIEGLDKLYSLELIDGGLNQIEGIHDCPLLEHISLRGNQLLDIPEMGGLPALVSLDLDDNQISKISFNEPNGNVKRFNISNNPLESLNGVDELQNLEILLAQNDRYKALSNLEGLENLHQLKEVNVSYNELETLEPLLLNEQLEVIIASQNKITDYQYLKPLTKVVYMEGVGNPAPKECPWDDSNICRFDWFIFNI